MSPKIIRKNVKHLRLDMRFGELVIVAPKNMPVGKIVEAIRKHTHWIESKRERIEEYIREAEALGNVVVVFGRHRKQLPDISELRKKLRKRAEEILMDLNKRTGLTYKDLIIRNMRTKWASYTPNRNIVLNLRAAVLPEKHLKYLLLHELAHSVTRKHNSIFWSIIRNYFDDQSIGEIERDLGMYWFYAEINDEWRRALGCNNLRFR